MVENSFSHSLFWHHPISTLCFFAFAMSFISLWVRKTAWLWGSFLIIAYVLALHVKIATWMSLVPISILFFCHYFLRNNPPKNIRFLLFCIATSISFALVFHFLPGFHNWQFVSQLCLSPGAYPYSLWLNFDKPFIGLFVLAFTLPLITSKTELLRVLKISIPLTIIGILIMMGISMYFNFVIWDPKLSIITFVWFFDNLIFVSIPEEAFFRGFIQRELYRWFEKNPLASFGSISVTSLFFSLLHLAWVANLPFLCLVFIASMIYGTIYQVTKSIEASILCHFGLNAIHFLFFTYPSLQN
jgi:membrane protease YdiL (CAAX protease family)